MVKLIVVRHGQSTWNLENRFTGWIDVPLSEKGVKEARKIGRDLSPLRIDYAFTSNLIRAQETLYEILQKNKSHSKFVRIPQSMSGRTQKRYSTYKQTSKQKKELTIYTTPALNERHYGDLQGIDKQEAALKFGEDKVKEWRRSFKLRPPSGESLKDTQLRCVSYFKKNIVPELKNGKNILVVAHGNSLRALIMEIENIREDKIKNFEIGTGEYKIYTKRHLKKYL